MTVSLSKSNIGIFVLAFSRLAHLKKTLSSLDDKLSKKDKIYIFCDNFTKNHQKQTINNVIKVINYLKKLNPNRFVVTFRKKRLGMTKNWHLAWSYMFNKYEKVICLEDDIVIGKDFLPFMKYYLNFYKDNKKVMNISGFSTKINLPKNYIYDCYLTKRSMSWGQGSWRRVWVKFKRLKQNHKKILKIKSNKKKLISEGGQDLLRTMTLDYLKIVESIQVWWIWNILKNNGYCINPVGSLINNIGWDGSGIHTKKGDSFPKSKNYKKKIKMKKLFFSKEINKKFLERFNIKKFNFFLFNFLHSSIINYLFKLKKIINN